MNENCFVVPSSRSEVHYDASEEWIKLFNALFYFSVKKNEPDSSTKETILDGALSRVESLYETFSESLIKFKATPISNHKCLIEDQKCRLTDEVITKIFVKEYEKNCVFTEDFAEKYEGDKTIGDVTINYCCKEKFGYMFQEIETSLHEFLHNNLNNTESFVNLIKLFYLKIAKKLIDNNNADEFKLRYFLIFEKLEALSSSNNLFSPKLKSALIEVSDYHEVLFEELSNLEPKKDLEAVIKDLDVLKDIEKNFSKNIIKETFEKLMSEFLPF